MNDKLKSDLKNKIRDEFVHGYLDEENKKVFIIGLIAGVIIAEIITW